MKDQRTRLILSRVSGVLAGFSLFGGILLWPAGSLAGPSDRTVKVTLKICVTEQGVPVDLRPTLFNTPSKVKQRDGDCYTTGPINLDPSLMYFVAATRTDLSGFAYTPVIVTPADAGKTIPIDLPLHARDKTSASVFEICLSGNNDQLSLTDIKTRDGNPIVVSGDANSRCRQITAASSTDVKLDLVATARPAGAGSGSRWTGLGVALLLLLSAGGLVLTVWVLNGLRDLTSNTATNHQIEQITGQLAGLEKIVCDLKISPSPPRVDGEQAPDTPQQGDGRAAPLANESPDRSSLTQPAEKPPQAVVSSQFDPQGSDARQHAIVLAREQYQRFARGELVPHFYLMPSGASAASNMVEDLVVELHERSNGTYVGFRTAAEDEAWIFPMPGIHFTSEAFKPVFPDLTAESYESGSFDPRLVVLKAEGRWIPT